MKDQFDVTLQDKDMGWCVKVFSGDTIAEARRQAAQYIKRNGIKTAGMKKEADGSEYMDRWTLAY